MRREGAVAPARAGRMSVVVALASVLIGISASSAAIGTTSGAPPGSPALDRMALTVTDLAAGGSIRRQGYVKDRDFLAYYVREFKPGARLGKSVLSGLESDTGVTTNRADAAKLVARIEAALRSKSFRRAFATGVLQDAGWDQAGLEITFGGIRGIAGGDGAFVAPLSLSLPGRRRFAVVLEVVRVDRAVQLLYLLSAPNTKIVSTEATSLAGIVAVRMRAALIPASVARPTISGPLQEGQTLAAGAGSWTNSPTAFAFQWLRCASGGVSCAPIDGAVAVDYVLTTADVGSTIELSVIATNGVGSSEPVASTPSEVVATAAPAPAG